MEGKISGLDILLRTKTCSFRYSSTSITYFPFKEILSSSAKKFKLKPLQTRTRKNKLKQRREREKSQRKIHENSERP